MEKQDFRPTVFWSWNGELSRKRIEEQIEGFAAAGIGGVFLHARAGLKTPYLGEAWFGAVRAAVDDCKAAGLSVWIYDENGWPSGFGNGVVNAVPEYRLKNLRCADRPTPEYAAHPVAVYRGEPGARVRCRAGEAGTLYLYYMENAGYADLLEPAAVRLFIESTHERYAVAVGEEFGKTILGVFTDEPQLSADGKPFSPHLLETFRSKFGREPLDGLYQLFEDGADGRRFRRDYFAAVSSCMTESYTAQTAAWCKAHGLLFTGHFPCEDGLTDQPGISGGVMPHYAVMDIPGVDHLGNRVASPVLVKQLAFVCRQAGKARALSETFGCMGWNATFADFARIWGVQASLGANLACMHLGAYTLAGAAKRDYPPVFSEQESWWPAFRYLADFLTGISRAAAEGEPCAEILALAPFREVTERLYRTDGQSRASAAFRQLVQNLLDAQADFDLAADLSGARLSGGALVLGKCAYRFVFVSETDALSKEERALLADLSRSGGRVFYLGVRPDGGEGDCVQNRRELLGRALRIAGYRWRVCFEGADGQPVPGLTQEVRRLPGGDTLCVVANGSESAARRVTARFTGRGRLYERCPETGRESGLPARTEGENTAAEVRFQPGETRVFRFAAGETGQPACPAARCEKAARVAPYRVEVGKNSLTLDTARWRVAGGAWSAPEYAPGIAEKLSAYPGEEAEVRYVFHAAYLPRDLTLAAETDGVERILLNGAELTGRRSGTFLDPAVSEFPAAARAGKNELIVVYRVPENGAERAAAHEAERNKSAAALATECVYLRGSFKVSASSVPKAERGTYRLNPAEFRIEKPEPFLPEGDLTPQGLWFYRGTADYVCRLPKAAGRTKLAFPNFSGAAVELFVNGRPAGAVFRPPFMRGVTEFLTEEENEAVFRLYGTNRNLLGPHRHCAGDPRFVGPESFFGKAAFGDAILYPERGEDVAAPDMCFVPFGLGDVYLVTES